MSLFVAELSEIILAVQRDESQINALIKEFSSIFKMLFGELNWIRWYNFFPYICRFLYYSATNLFNKQTIGEEYVQLIQVSNQSLGYPVLLQNRLLFVLFEAFGDRFAQQLINRLHIIAKKLKFNYLRVILLALNANNINELYKAFVLITNYKYFTIPRLLTGISYLSLRPQSNLHISKLFVFVGISIVIQTICLFLMKVCTNIKKEKMQDDLVRLNKFGYEENKISTHICNICSLQTFPVCTPCGHLFCWNCVTDYSVIEGMKASYGRCPNCRFEFKLNRIIPLLNF